MDEKSLPELISDIVREEIGTEIMFKSSEIALDAIYKTLLKLKSKAKEGLSE